MGAKIEITPQILARIRGDYKRGLMRKAIAAKYGYSIDKIARVCADLSPPIEHRGSRGKQKQSRILMKEFDDEN